MPNQYEYTKTFFDRWYRPEYATVIVVGDVKPAETLPPGREVLGRLEAGLARRHDPAGAAAKGAGHGARAWPSDTLPWVTVAFHGPAFSETEKDFAGARRPLRPLVRPDVRPLQEARREGAEGRPASSRTSASTRTRRSSASTRASRRARTPSTSATRSSRRSPALRDEARGREAPRGREVQRPLRPRARPRRHRARSPALLARFVRLRRSYGTLNTYYRLTDSLTPADLQAAATDVPHGREHGRRRRSRRTPMPAAMATLPPLATLRAPRRPRRPAPTSRGSSRSRRSRASRSSSSSRAGSAHDPAGKEGLAALTARMIADAGSQDLRIDEIRKAFFPVAASFDGAGRQGDDDLHGRRSTRTPGRRSRTSRCRSCTAPGFRDEDFRRIKDAQRNALDPEPPQQQRGGARQGAPPDAHLRRHALRPPRPRDGRRDRRDHARRREGLREEGLHAREPDRRGRRRRPRGADERASRTSSRRSRPRPASRRPPPSPGRSPRASRSRSSRRRRARPRSRSASRSTSRARIPTSRRSRSRAPGSASTARPARTSTSASARCAG